MSGVVDKISVNPSYGFIFCFEDRKYYFFDSIKLKVGDLVSFKGGKDRYGYFASKVKRCN